LSAVSASAKGLCSPLAALALAGALAGCASSVSTSSFKGEQHDVAQTISDLQSDATAGDEQKICANDLAAPLVAQLNTVQEERNGRSVRRTVSGRCRQVVKDQLSEIDSTDMKVESVTIAQGAARRSASARVRSVYSGKRRFATLLLLKEGARWKIARLG
jgi:hypothetical protein